MAKQTPSEKSTSLAATWWSGAVGTAGAIATSLADDALVLMKTTKYGKYYESAKLAVESTAGLILNEGLEVSKDGEKGGWSDGYLDFAEDVALTVGGNYLGGLTAVALLGSSAPALVTAAVGVGTAALLGGAYSWGERQDLGLLQSARRAGNDAAEQRSGHGREQQRTPPPGPATARREP